MLLPLLLSLVWAGDWTLGDKCSKATECKENYQKQKLEVTESVTVQEALCILVSCTFSYPTSTSQTDRVYSSWFRSGADINCDSPVATNKPERAVHEETRGRFHLRNLKNNCSLDIRDAQRGDGGSYFILVEKGNTKWNHCGKPVSVQVTAAIHSLLVLLAPSPPALTHTPHVDIPPTLEPGHTINLTCSVPWACERGTPPIFSWMSAAPTSLGPRTILSSVLTLTPRPQDHGTNLTCQVTFPGARVTVERTVQLNLTTGNSESAAPAGVVLGAIGGAGVTALLAVCLCLIFFIVKTQRKKAARTTVNKNPVYPAAGSAFQGQQQDSKVYSPAEGPSVEIEEDVHYASFSFHRPRPQKDPTPQYSEIRTH